MSSTMVALKDSDLESAFESACNMAATLYAQGADTVAVDVQVEVFLAELMRRGLA